MPNATVTAQVALKPQASQTMLVAMVVLAGVSVVCGTMLLTFGMDAGWAVAGLSLPFAGIAVWGWFSSQADTDLRDSKPTTISTPDGLTVTTDSRTLRSPTAAQALLQLYEASVRQKLPQADGVMENGVLVPDSAATAHRLVEQINDIVEGQARNLEGLLNRTQNGPAVIQGPAETSIPADDSSSRLNSISPR